MSRREDYKGFAAGMLSGVAKMSVGHPFDTVKVRLQTTSPSRFSGPLDVLRRTVRSEGPGALYKGASPPLAAWAATDAIMLGSLTLYRRLLHQSPPYVAWDRLPPHAHGLAGIAAGWTVSLVAAPVEHIKSRLQLQYAEGTGRPRLYSGPLDCIKKITNSHGLPGLYRGLMASMLFRSFFFVWWSVYDLLDRLLASRTALSPPAIHFAAGGLSAQAFWLTAYPSDLIKQRLMADPLGGSLADGTPTYHRGAGGWAQAAADVAGHGSWRGFWRGFAPCFLRAFPANATAMLVFEWAMRL